MSELTSSFTIFSNLTLIQFLFNFHMLFLVFSRSIFTILFRTLLFRSKITSLCCKSNGITFISLTYFLSLFPTSSKSISVSHPIALYLIFLILFLEPCVCDTQLFHQKTLVVFLPHFVMPFSTWLLSKPSAYAH